MERRVVAAQDQLDALQPHLAVRLGPTPVVADHHADPAAERVPHPEPVGRGLEVVALGVLERAVGFVLLVAGDVDLLERGDDRAVALDQRLHVPPMDAVGAVLEQRVAEAEPHAEPLGLVEQRLRHRVRHRALVVMVGLGDVVDEPSREERRQRQLRIHDQIAAGVGRLVKEVQQTHDHLLASVLELDRPQLPRSDPNSPRHGNSLHPGSSTSRCLIPRGARHR